MALPNTRFLLHQPSGGVGGPASDVEIDRLQHLIEERAVLTYLVGELLRRVGKRRESSQWFDRVVSEITEPSAQEWVLQVANQQRESPREWFE